MNPTDVVALLIGLAVVAGAVFAVVRGTRRRDNMGINLNRIHCPKCGAAVPMVRTPSSFKQAMWGGHTCKACGTEMDKWGRATGR